MLSLRKSHLLLLNLLLPLALALAAPNAAIAAESGTSGQTADSNEDANAGTAWTIRQNYFKRFKWAQKFGPKSIGGHDKIEDGTSQEGGSVTPKGPVFKWPKKIESGSASSVPTTRDEGILEYWVKTYGYPVSDTQYQAIARLNDNMMLEEAFDPERWMWMETAMGALKATSAANSVANLGRNQAVGAIDFCQTFLDNFTSDSSNVWNRIRSQLFIPMALLLLLPGAVLSQVRAIVAQGTTMLGDVNPFEGIIRSIIAIFLIPATYLVVNYGIDISNSINKAIRDGYNNVFHSDMYKDAMCAQKRAFPIRGVGQNKNQIPASSSSATNDPSSATGDDPYSQLESISFDVGTSEDCGGATSGKSDQGNSNDGKTDEESPVLKSTQRLLVNGANAGLTATWNVLCAFQMAYLYYLFCIGPVVAALWVWPVQQLRGALPSWIEGVIILCFWSLFWNTTVLLMAAFKGVGDTGTIVMTALNFLANSCVKYAFDFSGLVKAAGEQAGKEATKGMSGAGRGAGAGRDGSGAHSASGSPVPGGASGHNGSGVPGAGHGSGASDSKTAAANGGSSHAGVSSSLLPGLDGGAFGGGNANGHRGLTASDTLPPGGGATSGSASPQDGGTGGSPASTGYDGSLAAPPLIGASTAGSTDGLASALSSAASTIPQAAASSWGADPGHSAAGATSGPPSFTEAAAGSGAAAPELMPGAWSAGMSSDFAGVTGGSAGQLDPGGLSAAPLAGSLDPGGLSHGQVASFPGYSATNGGSALPAVDSASPVSGSFNSSSLSASSAGGLADTIYGAPGQTHENAFGVSAQPPSSLSGQPADPSASGLTAGTAALSGVDNTLTGAGAATNLAAGGPPLTILNGSPSESSIKESNSCAPPGTPEPVNASGGPSIPGLDASLAGSGAGQIAGQPPIASGLPADSAAATGLPPVSPVESINNSAIYSGSSAPASWTGDPGASLTGYPPAQAYDYNSSSAALYNSGSSAEYLPAAGASPSPFQSYPVPTPEPARQEITSPSQQDTPAYYAQQPAHSEPTPQYHGYTYESAHVSQPYCAGESAASSISAPVPVPEPSTYFLREPESAPRPAEQEPSNQTVHEPAPAAVAPPEVRNEPASPFRSESGVTSPAHHPLPVDRALSSGLLGSALGRAAASRSQPGGQTSPAAGQEKHDSPQPAPRRIQGSLQNQMRPGGKPNAHRKIPGDDRSTGQQEPRD